MKLSVILPAYFEPYLQKTIDCLLEKSELGDQLEVLVVMDGWTTSVKPDPRVRVLQFKDSMGMKECLNAGFREAKGEYIMKLDAHCAVDQGFDRVMVENGKENWLVVPRLYILDESTWDRDERRPYRDHHYFNSPKQTSYGKGIWAMNWPERTHRRRRIPIEDLMAVQGSCFMAHREYFLSHINLSKDYGPFAGEQLEVTLGYWLGDGEVKINKRTWYAHLTKRKAHYETGVYRRGYKKHHKTVKGHTNAAKIWLRDSPNRKPFKWLVDKFAPVPTW